MDIHKLYGIFLPFFRRKRMAQFRDTFHPTPETRILDIGGGVLNWSLIDCTSQITILNLTHPSDTFSLPPNFSFVKGDGTQLQFPDNSFDIVYSNSVIEHLHCYANQLRFANEARRVGKSLWIQTPAKSFVVEPHLLTPFIHYLPRKWQRRLLRNFSVWGLIIRPTQEQVDRFLDEVRLLTYKEMSELFPDCEIRKEKFFFLTKAYIAVRKGEEARL